MRLYLLSCLLATVSAEWMQMEPSIKTFSSFMWKRAGLRAGKDDTQIQVVFALKHDKSKRDSFEKLMLDISTPKSSKYGQHLSKKEVTDFLAPSQENLRKVRDYVSGFNPKTVSVSAHQDMIHVTLSVVEAERMLNTELAAFTSRDNRDITIVRATGPYYLPHEIAPMVNVVDNVVRFPSIRKTQLVETSAPAFGDVGADAEFSSCGAKCIAMTTPAVLQKRYGYPTLDSKDVASGNGMSVAEFQRQYYDDKDLSQFQEQCAVSNPVTVDETIGGNKESVCSSTPMGCVEALLDIEYIDAVASPIPLQVIYSGTFSLLDWVNGVLDSDSPSLVQSVSYGNDEVQQTSSEYMETVNTQFMAAGSRGISILFAAGDQGVWGRSGVGETFHPDFPAGSPYVTAVGGTNFQKQSTIGDESVWNCGGGGFSDEFAAPDYQTDAVNGYLARAELPDAKLFNAKGRGYPDVSALGGPTNPYCVSIHGGSKMTGVSGTSASCPVVAGIFAHLNNVRLSAGKPALGFLNPFLYGPAAEKGCFNDVDDGSENNCIKGTSGFKTTKGWDAATGLGTPQYQCLAKLM